MIDVHRISIVFQPTSCAMEKAKISRADAASKLSYLVKIVPIG